MWKKVNEYMTIAMAIIGTISMFGAVESIEIDKLAQGGALAMLGFASFILALYSQTLYAEDK